MEIRWKNSSIRVALEHFGCERVILDFLNVATLGLCLIPKCLNLQGFLMFLVLAALFPWLLEFVLHYPLKFVLGLFLVLLSVFSVAGAQYMFWASFEFRVSTVSSEASLFDSAGRPRFLTYLGTDIQLVVLGSSSFNFYIVWALSRY